MRAAPRIARAATSGKEKGRVVLLERKTAITWRSRLIPSRPAHIAAMDLVLASACGRSWDRRRCRRMRDVKTIVNTARRQLAKQVEVDRNKTAPACRNCPYYHPEFKYRRCLLSSCPFGKPEKCIFRDRPLPKDPFTLPRQKGREAVIRSA